MSDLGRWVLYTAPRTQEEAQLGEENGLAQETVRIYKCEAQRREIVSG